MRRQKIEAWNEDESKTIEMYVHEGQQPFAIELIKFMYTGEVVYTKGRHDYLMFFHC